MTVPGAVDDPEEVVSQVHMYVLFLHSRDLVPSLSSNILINRKLLLLSINYRHRLL